MINDELLAGLKVSWDYLRASLKRQQAFDELEKIRAENREANGRVRAWANPTSDEVKAKKHYDELESAQRDFIPTDYKFHKRILLPAAMHVCADVGYAEANLELEDVVFQQAISNQLVLDRQNIPVMSSLGSFFLEKDIRIKTALINDSSIRVEKDIAEIQMIQDFFSALGYGISVFDPTKLTDATSFAIDQALSFLEDEISNSVFAFDGSLFHALELAYKLESSEGSSSLNHPEGLPQGRDLRAYALWREHLRAKAVESNIPLSIGFSTVPGEVISFNVTIPMNRDSMPDLGGIEGAVRTGLQHLADKLANYINERKDKYGRNLRAVTKHFKRYNKYYQDAVSRYEEFREHADFSTRKSELDFVDSLIGRFEKTITEGGAALDYLSLNHELFGRLYWYKNAISHLRQDNSNLHVLLYSLRNYRWRLNAAEQSSAWDDECISEFNAQYASAMRLFTRNNDILNLISEPKISWPDKRAYFKEFYENCERIKAEYEGMQRNLVNSHNHTFKSEGELVVSNLIVRLDQMLLFSPNDILPCTSTQVAECLVMPQDERSDGGNEPRPYITARL